MQYFTKFYFLVVTLSTQDNAKLLQQLNSGFIRTIHWNKYQSKVTIQRQNQYLTFLINPSFQRVSRLSVLSLEDRHTEQVTSNIFLQLLK